MLTYIKTIGIILIAICIISCSDNQSEKISKTSGPKDNNLDSIAKDSSLKEEVKKSYDIKGFMSFNNETTFELATSYLDKSGNIYFTNPESVKSVEYAMYCWPGAFSLESQWPLGKFIFVQELSFENLTMNHVLFAFYNNHLSFISFGAVWDFNHLSPTNKNPPQNVIPFTELMSLYEKKYGKGEVTENKSPGLIFSMTSYYNKLNGIGVSFREMYEPIYNSTKERRNMNLLLSITFANYNKFFTECELYNDKRRNKELQEKNDNEKKKLDKI